MTVRQSIIISSAIMAAFLLAVAGFIAMWIPWGGLGLELSPLAEAAQAGNLKEVKRLLDAGADVNIRDANGDTPLTKALDQRHWTVAELLRKRGADVNAVNRHRMSMVEHQRFIRNQPAVDWLRRNGAVDAQ